MSETSKTFQSSFLYHYHAEYRTPTRVTSIDGIASLAGPIKDMASYRALKSVIVRDLGPVIPPEDLIITSLSPLERG